MPAAGYTASPPMARGRLDIRNQHGNDEKEEVVAALVNDDDSDDDDDDAADDKRESE